MPVNLDAIGIQSVELTLAESVEVTRKVETKPLLDKDGRFADAKAFDPTSEFNIKGRGDLPAGIAAGTDGGLDIAGISGGVTIVTSVKEGQKNDDWNTWECSGQNFPNAS